MSPHNRAPKSRKKGKKSNTFPNSYSLKKNQKQKNQKRKRKPMCQNQKLYFTKTKRGKFDIIQLK